MPLSPVFKDRARSYFWKTILVKRLLFLFSVSLAILLSFCNSRTKKPVSVAKKVSAFNRTADKIAKESSLKTAIHFADSLRHFLKRNGYSSRLIFIADMNLHMFVNRFYAINPDSSKVLGTFLVAHGRGGRSKWDSVAFSNVPGSLCTSKGRYKIGNSYYGEFGKGYKLFGLDATNNNAFKRLVVFHSYFDQTESEYSKPNYMSSGCPMLAPKSFYFCDSLVQKEKKPVMMVIY